MVTIFLELSNDMYIYIYVSRFQVSIVTIEYMASKDYNYIQSDGTISDLLSPTHSACRQYKPRAHIRKLPSLKSCNR